MAPRANINSRREQIDPLQMRPNPPPPTLLISPSIQHIPEKG
jgi:hypothetical protein